MSEYCNKPNPFDFIINGDDKKLLSKIYNNLLILKMQMNNLKNP